MSGIFSSRSRRWFLVAVVIAGSLGAYWWQGHAGSQTAAAVSYKTPQEADPYVRFDMEVYDDISAHYWQPASDAQLAPLFQLSLAKAAAASSEPLATSTRDGVAEMFANAFTGLSTTTEQQLALQTAIVALYNLAPPGRDQLLSQESQTALANTVNNVNPSQDLYGDLGLQKGASESDVAQAVAQKSAVLAATTSASGRQQLAQVQQAAATLANPTAKTVYDQTGAQATVFSHILNSHTLYLDISSVAPTTMDELLAALDDASSTPALDQLVIDLRGNIGGDLSFAQEFLSLFYGPNQYAFDLFHQGNLQVQRTGGADKSAALGQFKQIAVLTDDMTQSTAELVASALKHDRLATVVGQTTRGWGSVEQVIPMQTVIDPSETYALEIVAYLTVRDDGLPIEGNGVVPDVSTLNTDWKSQLSQYFYSSSLIAGVEKALSGPPMQ